MPRTRPTAVANCARVRPGHRDDRGQPTRQQPRRSRRSHCSHVAEPRQGGRDCPDCQRDADHCSLQSAAKRRTGSTHGSSSGGAAGLPLHRAYEPFASTGSRSRPNAHPGCTAYRTSTSRCRSHPEAAKPVRARRRMSTDEATRTQRCLTANDGKSAAAHATGRDRTPQDDTGNQRSGRRGRGCKSSATGRGLSDSLCE
jgi:hypothetical protein